MTPTLFVCVNRRLGAAGSCAAGGGVVLAEALRADVARRSLDWRVEESVCMGHCAVGPNVKAAPGGPMMHGCRAEDAAAIIGRLLEAWTPR